MNRRFDFITWIILPLAVAGLPATWISLWARWLVRIAADAPAPAPSISLLAGLALLAALTTRMALRADRPLADSRRLVLGAAALGLLLSQWWLYPAGFPGRYLRDLLDWGASIAPGVISLAACALAWWRGVLIGRSRVLHEDLETAFYTGILALAALFVLNHFQPRLGAAEASGPLLVFFAAGASALALVSFERARRQQFQATGAWLTLNRYWLATVGAVIGLILAGGLLLALIFSPDSLRRVSQFFAPAVDWLSPYVALLLSGLIIAFGWVLAPILDAIMALLKQLTAGAPPPTQPQPPPPSPVIEQLVDQVIHSPAFQSTSRGLTIILFLAGLAVLMALALRRFRLAPEAEDDEQRDSVLSRNLLLDQWRALFRRPAAAGQPPPYLALTGPEDARLAIRRAYQGMLEWARRQGLERAPGQTPRAYAARLAESQPPAQAALEQLTEAYQSARYAAEAPSAAQAAEAEAAVQSITRQPG